MSITVSGRRNNMSETLQEMISIFKDASNGRSSAGKLLWSLASHHLSFNPKREIVEKPQIYFTLDYYKDLLPYNTTEVEPIILMELEQDLQFIKDTVVSKRNNEKCKYTIRRGNPDLDDSVMFQFPRWFIDTLSAPINPFQFCFEEK